MKKILMTFILCLSALFASAQIATENSKPLDNLGIGATFGASTPLDLDAMFPVNTTLGIMVTKDITPVLGTQLEFTTALNDNHIGFANTTFKYMNLGLNGTLNISNIIGDYIGRPRSFEVSAVGGLGWFKAFDGGYNNISLKTGSDLAFNFGKKKIHSLVITPSIYWLLRNNPTGSIQLNNNNAVISLMATYIYHFKNSNGTHHFKTWDVGALLTELNYEKDQRELTELALKRELDKKPVEKVVEKVVHRDRIIRLPQNKWFVEFAVNSAALTDSAKVILNNIPTDAKVKVFGTCSPDGKMERNKALSERRAAAVADFLNKRNVKVISQEGRGSTSDASNRLAVITQE